MRNLKEDKLYIQAFREIRSYIIRNELKAGDLLPTEQNMCQMLGVSRNVLREAIKSMELMGMIQSVPGRGTMIKEFNLDFIFQNVLFFTASASFAVCCLWRLLYHPPGELSILQNTDLEV